MKTRGPNGSFIKDKSEHFIVCLCCKSKKICRVEADTKKLKFCSFKCYLEFKKNNKSLYPSRMTAEITKKAHEKLKQLNSDPEFKKRHSANTSEAMKSPEVQAKLHVKKGPPSLAQRAHQSDALVGKRPKNITQFMHSSCVRSIHGWLELGDKKYWMRSIWERNVARYFEFLKKNGQIKEWEYEPERFIFHKVLFGNRSYLPDFRITENNGDTYFVEVKGFMDKSSAVKLKRMRKFYPQHRVDLLQKDRYCEIARWAKIIDGWEWEQVSKRVKFWMKKHNIEMDVTK